MFIACSLHVHCMLISCSGHGHQIFIACSLHVRCIFIGDYWLILLACLADFALRYFDVFPEAQAKPMWSLSGDASEWKLRHWKNTLNTLVNNFRVSGIDWLHHVASTYSLTALTYLNSVISKLSNLSCRLDCMLVDFVFWCICWNIRLIRLIRLGRYGHQIPTIPSLWEGRDVCGRGRRGHGVGRDQSRRRRWTRHIVGISWVVARSDGRRSRGTGTGDTGGRGRPGLQRAEATVLGTHRAPWGAVRLVALVTLVTLHTSATSAPGV